jgi:DNA-damage-inducible protein D
MSDGMDQVEGFEVIKVIVDEKECWSARELMPLLGYEKWETFSNVIRKAQVACSNSGQPVENHFFLTPGKSEGGRPAEDYMLTRYACYLVAQNGSSLKPQVAFAQTYFAAQTLRQEAYDKLSDDEKRLYIRTQVKEGTKKLNTSAKQHGVNNYAFFHNAGYKGLYGMFLSDIKYRKGLDKKADLLDMAGSTELAANLFRITQTEERLSRDFNEGRRHGQQGAQLVDYSVGSKVRQAIEEIGGVPPEDLPTEENIKALERRMKKNDKKIDRSNPSNIISKDSA